MRLYVGGHVGVYPNVQLGDHLSLHPGHSISQSEYASYQLRVPAAGKGKILTA